MVRKIASLGLALVFAACGEGVPSTTTGVPVLTRDFDGYESWQSYVVAGSDVSAPDAGLIHTAGARTVYLKQAPPSGSTEWPVGTLIVKVGRFNTFAMHKRGGTYNAKGARGWEWVELEKTASGQNIIVWQGLGAPAGEQYGESTTTCNDCHKTATTNDSVLDGSLLLSGF